MADSLDDYMSDNFLNVTDDIRPGLVYSRSQKRKYELEHKEKIANKRNCMKPQKVLEEERRNEGLDSALSTSNKGFSLLQKMGYKPGMKIGKQSSNSSSSGLNEPIKPVLKCDRGGLGRDAEIKQKMLEREAHKSAIKIWKAKETEKLTEDYQKRMRDKLNAKKILGDLRACQKVCERLDIQAGIDEPLQSWYWFVNPEETEEEDDSDKDSDVENDEDYEELEPSEKLDFLVDYLRETHCYCVWCGTSYNDAEDMMENCPGKQREDHE